MDILIKDFADKMPQTCYECPFAVAHITTLLTSSFGRGSYCCVLTHKTITSTRRNRFCPLVEINGERKDDE